MNANAATVQAALQALEHDRRWQLHGGGHWRRTSVHGHVHWCPCQDGRGPDDAAGAASTRNRTIDVIRRRGRRQGGAVSYDGTPATSWVLVDNEATAIQATWRRPSIGWQCVRDRTIQRLVLMSSSLVVWPRPTFGRQITGFAGRTKASCHRHGCRGGDKLKLYGGECDTGELGANDAICEGPEPRSLTVERGPSL